MKDHNLPLTIEGENEGTIYALKISLKNGFFRIAYKLQNSKPGRFGFPKTLLKIGSYKYLEQAVEAMYRKLNAYRNEDLQEAKIPCSLCDQEAGTCYSCKNNLTVLDKEDLLEKNKHADEVPVLKEKEMVPHSNLLSGFYCAICGKGYEKTHTCNKCAVTSLTEDKTEKGYLRFDPKQQKWVSEKQYVEFYLGGAPVDVLASLWLELPEFEMPKEEWERILEVKKAVEDSPYKAKVIRGGYTYELGVYEVLTDLGLVKAEHTRKIIRFVKGSKTDESIERQEGVLSEEVLDMVKKNLEFNQLEIADDFTKGAIWHIKEAIANLAARKLDRQKRGVFGTREK